MELKIEHIGILVRDLEAAIQKYATRLGLEVEKVEEIEVDGALNRVAFLPVKDTHIELVQTTAETGLAADFLKKHGEGIHHIALEVDDIQAELDRLKGNGIRLINEKPYLNAHEEQVAFIHPKSTYGVLIELVQKED